MRLKIKLAGSMFLFLFVIYLILPPFASEMRIKNIISEKTMVHVSSLSGNLDVELEEYLIGVVASEMPAQFEIEALKAQAVAARTYVYSRELQVDDTVNSQVYQKDELLKEKWKDKYEEYIQKVKEAVSLTKGQVLMYDQKIINAYFFSSSNGKTNNSEDYWTTAYPYLISVDSHYDSIKKDNQRVKEISFEEINRLFGFSINQIEVISQFESSYVKEVKINDQIFSGKKVREICSLSSSSFEVEKTDTGFVFTTLGSGHGVGMSQYGAQGMALEGYDYRSILKHYYSGVEIVNK